MQVLSFEDRYEETLHWVEKRRRTIDLAHLGWDDIRQRLLIRVSQQYSKYEPDKGLYSHWVNTVISNELRNIWRDEYASSARPCVSGGGGCIHNVGADQCSKTPSGLQCAECPIYRDWERRKGSHYAIRMPLPLENHAQEVHSGQSDFVDYDGMAAELHRRMKARLTRSEWKAWRLLYILHKEPEDVAKALGFKGRRKKGQRMYPGYAQVLALRHELEKTAREEARKMAA